MSIQAEDVENDDSLCVWSIPTCGDRGALELPARKGKITTIVGANGSGKSALGIWLRQNSGSAQTSWVRAHRRLWFEHSGSQMTGNTRETVASQMEIFDQEPVSRWVDRSEANRQDMVIFDLLSKQRAYDRDWVKASKEEVPVEQIFERLGASPIERLNSVFSRGYFPVRIELSDTDTLDAVRLDDARFPASQMSDGEKSAMLLVLNVLNATTSSIQIIDEPERHMHRSISVSLVESVIEARPDCHFVTITHDLELAQALHRRGAQVVSLHGCSWSNSDNVRCWNAYKVEHSEDLEPVRRAILGSREKVLFVEGCSDSLDRRLYELLAPDWYVEPAGTCGEVIRATKGVFQSDKYHWVKAAGVVDRDRRSESECDQLKLQRVFVLGLDEVENVYLSEEVLRSLSELQASTVGIEATELLRSAIAAGMQELARDEAIEHLAAQAALKIVNGQLIKHRLDKETVKDPERNVIEVELGNPFSDEVARLSGLINECDLFLVLRDYSVRDSGMPATIAKKLGYSRVEHMQNAARECMRNDSKLLEDVRSIAGILNTELEAGQD